MGSGCHTLEDRVGAGPALAPWKHHHGWDGMFLALDHHGLQHVDLQQLVDAAAGSRLGGLSAPRAELEALARRRGGRRLAQLLADVGLVLTAVELDVDLGGAAAAFDQEVRRLDELLRVLRGMAAFGAGDGAAVIRLPAGPLPSRDRLRAVAAATAPLGVRLLLESEGSLGPAEAAALAREVAPQGVGVVADSARWCGEDLRPLADLPLGCRLRDRAADGTPQLPGEGALDLVGWLGALHGLEYRGALLIGAPAGVAEPMAAARLCQAGGERILVRARRQGWA